MNAISVPRAFSRVGRKPLLLILVLLAALAIGAAAIYSSRPAKAQSSFYEVKRGDFLISIVEGGSIESVNEEIIRSDVEGTARIIFIVKEGSTVAKGDLLVELDSSASQDAVNVQQIAVEKAQFALIQAEQQLEIQKSTVDSEVAAAQLKVEFALLDRDKYVKGEAQQTRRNAEIEVTNVLETLKIAEERLGWTDELFKQSFETKANLDKDKLAASQNKLKLEQARQALWMIETFDIPKKKRELEAALQEAKENLDRVKRQGENKLAQYTADVQTQKSTLELSKSKLARDLVQLKATKIFAPQDGLVVYGGGGGDRRFSSESMVEEGAVVRNRQEIIKLPDISEMKLTVKIHESHINHVRPGQAAYVVLDAMPDQRFRAHVNRVAPLPDSGSRWGNPNLKVYATELRITDPMPDVKPGVSARAEVVVTNLENSLTVPIQAVTTRKGQQVVFLSEAPTKPVPVSVGMYNIKFIEITSGLKEGDHVLLSPPFETDEKDLGGAIIASGDSLPPNATNIVARSSGREIEGGRGGGPGRPGRGRGVEAGGTEGRGREFGQGGPSGSALGGQPESGGRPDGAARPEGGGRRRGEGGGQFNREEMIKQFDANGDGKLDETETAAMRERFGSRRRNSTNDPPNQTAPASPDGTR